ncbi:choice-of-anchor tandem repeat GloVer-containing protein [Pseudobacter ginsenosidimutans]|uniref:Putative secreted protein (Por secretion system target) n=1 Tax=Pseudobacter ginsenosidimutans TaxID=661488 RepID=A0A4Q7N3J5_9BACT|nr:choice-of-anchor tandem repeat GloVer-containing protein [Pseudobacter ginsenosidimutans]QEC44129.1 T9SS type A sorting domain-containing protein [Pseudobacter ginsenosidimutans]RZS75575.1 putative secreted protein (Por secretion system target) [Pseudobacter ginsenosidimutans]
MKKLYFLALTLTVTLTGMDAFSQGIYQFWGVTPLGGGSNDQGALYSARFDGTGITGRKAFEIYTHQSSYFAKGFKALNGKIYGFLENEGPYAKGIIYEFDPANNTYTKKLDLASYDLFSYSEFEFEYNNKLYGTTSGNKFYEYDPAANTLVLKGTADSYYSSFTFYNNKYYGTTYLGGANNYGYIFSFDPATLTTTKLMDLPLWSGKVQGFVLFNNKLYGIAEKINQDFEGGIVEYNPATNQLIGKAPFGDAGGQDGVMPLRLLNGKIYGTTAKNLPGDPTGVVFEYDPLQNTMVKKMDITASNPIINFPVMVNNKFYGVTMSGGNFDKGLIYEYDPLANTYTKKIHFSGLLGEKPHPLFTQIGGKIYGLTAAGGQYKGGVIYEYNPVANSIGPKVNMGYSNGYRPYGKLQYFQGKLFGFTTNGGYNNKGVIYAYDLATHSYSAYHHMQEATGYGVQEGSLVLHNNKFYGVTQSSTNGRGVIFEYDPLNFTYTVKHEFDGPSGASPKGRPVIHNNKIYGTTIFGGNTNSGVLYEYDLATNTYAVKLHFSNAFGTNPHATLCLYKNKLYGACSNGGTYGNGTLFEYTPAINGIVIKHHFTTEEGNSPTSGMTVLNDKLYGTLDQVDPQVYIGALYELEPVSGVVAIKHKFTYPAGSYPKNDLITHNKKLYGVTAAGGGIDYGGVFFEFDPALNKWTAKEAFNFDNGRFPQSTAPTLVPALVSPGDPGTCMATNAALINTTNANDWIAFTDKEGNAVMEINANGNLLGSVRVSFYVHDGETRKDQANRFYLNRNISVTVENQPATPVSIRLYIRKTEFEALKNTAGSGVQALSDITVFKNEDVCSNSIQSLAVPVNATATTWGIDYVYSAQVSSFSSFYFASKAYTSLPVKLEYFKGSAEANRNKLEWKASCTDNAEFRIERSADGMQFSEIGSVQATAGDCNYPFTFFDQQPVNGKTYYRVQMKDEKGVISYSNIVIIDRRNAQELVILLHPNPVQGGIANFSIQSPEHCTIPVAIYDVSGRMITRKEWTISKGSQTRQIDLQHTPPGMYTAVFPGSTQKPVKFIRK